MVFKEGNLAIVSPVMKGYHKICINHIHITLIIEKIDNNHYTHKLEKRLIKFRH